MLGRCSHISCFSSHLQEANIFIESNECSMNTVHTPLLVISKRDYLILLSPVQWHLWVFLKASGEDLKSPFPCYKSNRIPLHHSSMAPLTSWKPKFFGSKLECIFSSWHLLQTWLLLLLKYPVLLRIGHSISCHQAGDLAGDDGEKPDLPLLFSKYKFFTHFKDFKDTLFNMMSSSIQNGLLQAWDF